MRYAPCAMRVFERAEVEKPKSNWEFQASYWGWLLLFLGFLAEKQGSTNANISGRIAPLALTLKLLFYRPKCQSKAKISRCF